jgi:hypothetical protein
MNVHGTCTIVYLYMSISMSMHWNSCDAVACMLDPSLHDKSQRAECVSKLCVCVSNVYIGSVNTYLCHWNLITCVTRILSSFIILLYPISSR